MNNTPIFDQYIERRGSDSLKWDGCGRKFGMEGDDLLPMWLADMDFLTPEPVREAVLARAQHGVFGYTRKNERANPAICAWVLSASNLAAIWARSMVLLPSISIGPTKLPASLRPVIDFSSPTTSMALSRSEHD